MKENNEPPKQEKLTADINITGVPVTTLAKLDSKVEKSGITRSAYVKTLINNHVNTDGK